MTRLSPQAKEYLVSGFKSWIAEQISGVSEKDIQLTSYKSKYFPLQSEGQIEVVMFFGKFTGSNDSLKKLFNDLNTNPGTLPRNINDSSLNDSSLDESLNFYWPVTVIKSDDLSKVGADVSAYQIMTIEEGKYIAFDGFCSDLTVKKLFESINLPINSTDRNSETHNGFDEYLTVRRLAESSDGSQVYVIDSKYRFCLFKFYRSQPKIGVELLEKLDGAGFNNMAAPLARFNLGRNLAGLVVENFEGASTLEAMVNVSLRDLFDFRGDPNKAGGDLSEEFKRLGEMLAKLHTVLEDRFDSVSESFENITRLCDNILNRNSSKNAKLVKNEINLLESIENFGLATRIYNTIDLNMLLRTDMGWCLVDFGQEVVDMRYTPLINLAQILAKIKKVLDEQVAMQLDSDLQKINILSNAWFKLNSEAFIEGYMYQIKDREIVPNDPKIAQQIVMTLYQCMLARLN
jgi:hypothetical protein